MATIQIELCCRPIKFIETIHWIYLKTGEVHMISTVSKLDRTQSKRMTTYDSYTSFPKNLVTNPPVRKLFAPVARHDNL